MFKKNQPATLVKDGVFKELEDMAKSQGKTIRELVMDDKHPAFEKVLEIFYNNLPKLARMAMNKNKFRDFFMKNREMMLNQAGL